jgi:hypothetical protein
MAAAPELRVAAPALPQSPVEYQQSHLDKFNNILRLYFNRLDTAINNTMATQVPYNLKVSKGEIAGASSLYKFGYNPDIDTGEETIWTQGGLYVYPAAAAVRYVSSSNVNDTSAGTGARTVVVEGLDDVYAAASETVALNGQTQVVTVGQFVRVNRIYVATAGSGGTGAGTIYVSNSGATSGVPTGDVFAAIVQGENQSQMGIYTVPAAHSLYIDNVHFTAAISAVTNYATTKLVTRDFGSGVFRTRFINVMENNPLTNAFEYPLKISAKTDIECRALASVTNNNVSASFEGALILD